MSLRDKDLFRQLGAELAALQRKVSGIRAPQLRQMSLDDGSIPVLDDRRRRRMHIGKLADGTYGIQMSQANYRTIPPPSAPQINDYNTGNLRIRWDGLVWKQEEENLRLPLNIAGWGVLAVTSTPWGLTGYYPAPRGGVLDVNNSSSNYLDHVYALVLFDQSGRRSAPGPFVRVSDAI